MNLLANPFRRRRAVPLGSALGLSMWLAQASLLAQGSFQEIIPPPSSGLPSVTASPAVQAPNLAPPVELARRMAATSAASHAPHLDPWQERLTLGPGDVLEISLYGHPDSARRGIFIGPDGRLNYLQASEIEAAGLTVDELRAQLESVLGKFHLKPRVVINPVAYNSKKYFILGNVQNVGPFLLNRPVTILEAVARAGGLVTSAEYRNVVVQADLSRSFLARTDATGAATRVPVDFEAIMMRGDLSQNLSLNPGDYLYFPPIDTQEIYVVGAVPAPGVTPYTQELSALGAIVARGGFEERAYRGKILVIRGSLNDPKTFIVDANAILAGKQRDFPLQNKDIIYVARRPFSKVEELGEAAITSFLNGLIWGWTQNRVIPNLPQP
jgi:protein involved in polysaccharide export with SLBB domain